MSRYIDADALIADMQERYCKPCKEKGEDYNEVRCRACWVDDAIGDVDGFGDNSIDIVFCEDCPKHKVVPFGENACFYWCDLRGHAINPDDFCSYGERKDDE